MADSLAKAKIINLDKSGATVDCMFNPEQYSVEKRNTWNANGGLGTNMPHLQFSEGTPATLQMKLFFDTYATGKDVRSEYTDAIWELMLVDERLKDAKTGRSRPPRVRFQWGKAWSFDAVITRIVQSFSLFASNGTPVRAMLDVSFQQVKDAKLFPRQNPTSGAEGGERVWTVQDGDTLQWIAYSEYGDATRWRPIASANRLLNVRRLKPGTVLEIPRV